MIEANFLDRSEAAQSQLPEFDLGADAAHLLADYFVRVVTGSENDVLLKIFVPDEYCFAESLKVVGESVIAGVGESIHFFNSRTKQSKSIKLGGYISAISTPSDFEASNGLFSVLVATSTHLYHFEITGELLWKSKHLAIDGVIVQNVKNNWLEVICELDPPDGWVTEHISIKSGKSET